MTESASPQPVNSSIILLVLAVSGIAYAVLQAAVAPALPQLQRELDISLSSSTWILTAILLSAAVLTPMIGRMGDIYGKKRVLVVVLTLFAIGTVICALAPSLLIMLSGRVLQGVGGGIFPLAFGIIRDVFPRDKVTGAIGILSATLGIGGGFGIVVSGLIVKYLDTHFLFWIPLIPILFALLATWKYIPESKMGQGGTINWLGAILLGTGLTALLLGATRGNSWGWGSVMTIGMFTLSVAALIAWVISETRSRDPLINMKMMRIKGIWTANLVALLVGIGLFGSFTLTSQFLQMPLTTGYGFGKDVLQAGLFILPSSIMMLITGWASGPIERRFGSKPQIVVGTLITSIGFAFIALAHSEAWHFLLASFIFGIGIGFCFAALAGAVVMASPRDQIGAATGMNTVMRTIGSSLGSAVPGTILASRLIEGTPYPEVGAFVLVFWIIAGTSVLACALAILIPGRPTNVPSHASSTLTPVQSTR